MLQGLKLVIAPAAAHLNILMNDVIVSAPGGLFSRGRDLKKGKNTGKGSLNKSVMMDDSFRMCRETRAQDACANERCPLSPRKGYQGYG